MRRPPFLAVCMVFLSPVARAELEHQSSNTLVFVESAQKGHEWEAYRLAEDRRPVVMAAGGPGRVLLTLRTFSEGEAAVSVVLLDERIVLTANVEPKADENAKFSGEIRSVPSKVRLYLVRVPAGAHRITVRYSGGGPTLVAARFSSGTDTWGEGGEGDLPLVMPKVGPEREPVPTVGTLRESGVLEAEPQERLPARSRPPPALPEPPPDALPKTAPIKNGEPPRRSVRREAPAPERPLTVRAPWLLFEVRGGAQLHRIGLSVAPAIGVEARTPVPALDARSFSAGLSAEVAHTQGESELRAANQRAVLGVAEVRHTSFALSADLRWVFLREQLLDPYLAIGAGALFGSMSSSVGEHRIDAATRGAFALFVAGAALGGLGHRPYLEARLQAGTLFSELLRERRGPLLTASLMIGFRFEFLTDAPVTD